MLTRAERKKEGERRGINRYGDTASRRKPTSRQLSKGPVVGVLGEKTAGMHREQVARLPTFRNLRRCSPRGGTCPIVNRRSIWPSPEEPGASSRRRGCQILDKFNAGAGCSFQIIRLYLGHLQSV